MPAAYFEIMLINGLADCYESTLQNYHLCFSSYPWTKTAPNVPAFHVFRPPQSHRQKIVPVLYTYPSIGTENNTRSDSVGDKNNKIILNALQFCWWDLYKETLYYHTGPNFYLKS